MDKEALKKLKEKYKMCCVNCDKVKDKNKMTVNTCSSCKLFSKQDMALLLDGYYQSYHNNGLGTKLSLSDKVLYRVIELSKEGRSKYSIAKQVNDEFYSEYGDDVVTWKQVHYILTDKYASPESKRRIASMKKKVDKNHPSNN